MKIKAVIFDWAGTMIDYGCFAPVESLVCVFKEKGICLTERQARGPMGIEKKQHIRTLCRLTTVMKQWQQQYGCPPDEKDIDELYNRFEHLLSDLQSRYATAVPGFPELFMALKKKGIKIGSTTGYSKKIMERLRKEAMLKNYCPDSIVTPDDVTKGRPFPWMCFKNMENMEVYPPLSCIKVGDTISDIKEGLNAGIWSIGIIKGSSELGLSLEEVQSMPSIQLKKKCGIVMKKFLEAGAHYVLDTIACLPEIIEKISCTK